MRLQKLFRSLFLTAIAAAATFFILLGMGNLAPADGAPPDKFLRSRVTLREGEVMCLVHDPAYRLRGKPTIHEELFQSVRRFPPARYADDDFDSYPGTLLSAIQNAARLTRAQVEIPDDLASLPLRGDWLVRETATPDEKLNSLLKIVAQTTGRHLVFEKRFVEREVAIAQGYWVMRDPQGNAHAELMNIRTRDDDHRLRVGSGDIKGFLRHVENETGRMVINRISPPAPGKIIWMDGFRPERPVKNRDPVDRFFMSLANQTMLNFEIDDARIEVWFIHEHSATTQPQNHQ